MIRTELDKDIDESLHEDVEWLLPIKLFLGSCKGMACYLRGGENDPHIMLAPLTEDDGCWFLSHGGSSNYWLYDMIYVLEAVDTWLKTQEPDMYKGNQYGYKLSNKETHS